jgi:hypothetical protein
MPCSPVQNCKSKFEVQIILFHCHLENKFSDVHSTKFCNFGVMWSRRDWPMPYAPFQNCKCNLLSLQDNRLKTKKSDQVNLSDFIVLIRE